MANDIEKFIKLNKAKPQVINTNLPCVRGVDFLFPFIPRESNVFGVYYHHMVTTITCIGIQTCLISDSMNNTKKPRDSLPE